MKKFRVWISCSVPYDIEAKTKKEALQKYGKGDVTLNEGEIILGDYGEIEEVKKENNHGKNQ